MKPSTLLNLPVQTRRSRVINLHAVDAQIVFLRRWVFGVHQRQGDERPAVFVPRRQHWKLIQTRFKIDNLSHRPTRNCARAQLQKIANQRTMPPKLPAIGWQQRLSNTHQFLDKLLRFRSKGKLDSFGRAEKVGYNGKLASLHALEKQRRSVLLDDAAMNLGHFQAGIDFSFDGNKIVFAAQEIEEGTKISVH